MCVWGRRRDGRWVGGRRKGVVVVRTMVYDDHVYLEPPMHAPNWVAERLGASSLRPRHPFSALMAEVNPGPVPVHRALPSHLEQATRLARPAQQGRRPP